MSERLFIAINFDDKARSDLAALRDDIKKHAKRCSPVRTDNIHMTLVFIGDCDPPQTSVIRTLMNGMRFREFGMKIESIGRFRRGGGSLWWAGVSENKELNALQRELTEKLVSAGFDVDRRDYSPHITLAREVVTDEGPRQTAPIHQKVSSMELMRSEYVEGRLRYTAIHSKRADQ
ncbi:MAG: RNA 2',3'-cyclic phosphodiesterase [Methanomassiliicoccaceae archaeon]|jgi:2'-5' RNA ligase|nr:RNA 2',3'-cyclic phosphodiesterase [Methanomassiliicoccaceae archaeon]